MTDYKNIIVEKNNSTLLVTINRERALNALNKETIAELQSAFDEYQSDSAIRCVIVTGAGSKSFVAGADIAELSELDQEGGETLSRNGLKLMQTIQDFPWPVIAAINGFALGGGCELALACDIRLASTKARLGQPEVSLGLIPGYGGTQRLARIVGRGKAMQLILSGATIRADEAYRIGLVDEICEPEELMDKAQAMADEIASKGPLAIKKAKECINGGLEMTLAEGCQLEMKKFGEVCGTSDKTEGTKAFMEKRKPDFKGN